MFKLYQFCLDKCSLVDMVKNKAYFLYPSLTPQTLNDVSERNILNITKSIFAAVVKSRTEYHPKGRKTMHSIIDDAFYGDDSWSAFKLGMFETYEQVKMFLDAVKMFDMSKVAIWRKSGIEHMLKTAESFRSFVGDERTEKELDELRRLDSVMSNLAKAE